MKIFTFLKSNRNSYLQNVLGFYQFNTFLLCLLLWIGQHEIQGQIQWADGVQFIASANHTQSQSNLQGLLGMPDVVPTLRPDTKATTLFFANHTDKISIELSFAVPIPVLKIFIAENFGVGLKEITLKDETGMARGTYAVNENYDIKSAAKISHITLYQPTHFLVKSMVVVIYAPFNGKNECQIDAVGISSKDISLDYNFDGQNYTLPLDLVDKSMQINKTPITTKTLTHAVARNHTSYFPHRQIAKYTLRGQFVADTVTLPVIQLLVVNLKTNDSLVVHTEEDGSFQIGIDEADYLVLGFQKDYLSSKVYKVSTYGRKMGEILPLQLPMRPLQSTENYIFTEFNFDINTDTLDTQTAHTVAQIVTTLKANPKMTVRLEIHTDARGDDQYNLALSEQRANYLTKHLAAHGVPPQQYLVVGMGETEIRNHCKNGVRCDNATHKENRRIEMEILSLDTK